MLSGQLQRPQPQPVRVVKVEEAFEAGARVARGDDDAAEMGASEWGSRRRFR